MATNSTHINFVGRVGQAPRTQVTQGPKGERVVCGVSIAIDDDKRNADGSWQDQTMWMWTEGWNSLGERMSKLEVGDLVIVNGKIKQSVMEIGGQKVTRTKVWADSVRLVAHAKPKAEASPEAERKGDDNIEFEDAAGFGDGDVPF